jgi:hypothetical protein
MQTPAEENSLFWTVDGWGISYFKNLSKQRVSAAPQAHFIGECYTSKMRYNQKEQQ